MPIIASSHITASGQISGSSTTTGSFGVIEVDGGHFTSASLAAGGGGGGGGTITALNNATANELVTVGATTTELDAEANLTFDGSTLTVTGDATVTGDITIDDGGSLKEAGGTAAFTFDGSGHVTKIGQDSPSSDEVLKWDGSKWVAGSVSATVEAGAGIFAEGSTIGGVLSKLNSGNTGSFSDNITVETGSLVINSGSLDADLIIDGPIELDTAKLLYTHTFAKMGHANDFPVGIYFSPDGRRMFSFYGANSDYLQEFALSTPWDVRTATIGFYLELGNSYDGNYAFTMRPDGKAFYLFSDDIDSVLEYQISSSVSQPFELTGVNPSLVSAATIPAPTKYQNPSEVDGSPPDENHVNGIWWRPDGRRIYLLGQTTDSILQYKITGSDYDIGSMQFEKQLDISAQDNSPMALTFDGSGTQMFHGGEQNDKIYQYQLSQSWDIGTAVFVASTGSRYYNSSGVITTEAEPNALFIHPDRSTLYMAGHGSDGISTYSLTAASSSYYKKTDIFGNVNFEGGNTKFKPGGNLTISSSLNISDWSEVNVNAHINMPSSSIHPNAISRPIDVRRGVFQYDTLQDDTVNANGGFDNYGASNDNTCRVVWRPDGRRIFWINGGNSEYYYTSAVEIPWDPRTMVTEEKLRMESIYDNIYDIWVHPDGLRWWILVNDTNKYGVVEFKAKTPWTLADSDWIKFNQLPRLDGVGMETSTQTRYNFQWRPDGRKAYSTERSHRKIVQYVITGSAFDAGALRTEYTMQIFRTGHSTNAGTITFSPDGSQFFHVTADTGNLSHHIEIYKCKRNWDIRTARYDGSWAHGRTTPAIRSILFKPDMTGYWLVGSSASSTNGMYFFEIQENSSGSYDGNTQNITSSIHDKITISAPNGIDVYSNLDVKGELILQQGHALKSPYSSVKFDTGITMGSGSLRASSISREYDLSTAVYQYSTKDTAFGSGYGFDGINISTLWGISFKPDGTKMMVLNGANSEEVEEFTLYKPWDARTQYYTGRYKLPSDFDNPYGMWWHPDGDRFWTTSTDTTVYGIVEHRVHTPWDLSDVEPFKKHRLAHIESGSGIATSQRGLEWAPDGTRFWVTANQDEKEIWQYTLSGSAFDVGSAKLDYIKSLAGSENNLNDICFSGDGSMLMIVGHQNDYIKQYYCRQPWELSTAQFVAELNVTDKENNPTSLFLNPDGKGFYLGGTTGDDINYYAFDLTGSRRDRLYGHNQNGVLGDGTTIYHPTGSNLPGRGTTPLSIGSSTTLIGDLDVKGKLILQQGHRSEFKTGVEFDNGITSSTGSIHVSNISNPINLFVGKYEKTSPALDSIGDINGMHFSPDGRIVILCDDSGQDKIYRFELSIPWDITSITNENIKVIDIGDEEEGIEDVTMSHDGKWMFITGFTGDEINSYKLSVPWDINTATHSKFTKFDTNISSSKSGSAPHEADPRSVHWSPDGQKLFVLGNTQKSVLQYRVTGSAFDVGSLEYENRIGLSYRETVWGDVKFTDDGTQMFVVGSTEDRIDHYRLRKAWDVETATWNSLFTVGGFENSPNAIFLKPDASSLFVAGEGGEVIDEISLLQRQAAITGSPDWNDHSTQPKQPGKAKFSNTNISSSAFSLDMTGEVNLFGSMDVLQDINVMGYVDGNIRGHRPIIEQQTDFHLGTSTTTGSFGYYYRVTGSLTCSILVDPDTSASGYIPIGSEYDFFQVNTGNFLFESASGVTVNVKNNNMNLAGQFSSATLKKVRPNEWDLMGDLT